MSPADQALARRAVACAGWRWVPGMRSTCGRIVYAAGQAFAVGVYVGDQRVRPSCSALPHDALPDLTDPATLGCIEFGILAPLGIWIEGGTVGPWRARLWVDAEPVTDWTGLGRAHAVVAALEAACQG